MKTYHLFISHSWNYSDAYEKIIALLRGSRDFSFSDYSVPRDDPIHHAGTDAQLREAIWRQMALCSVILILAGVYATYSKWINIEIELATRASKPIVAIRPWGSERISVPVQQTANRIVGWNTASVVNAIKKLS